MSDGPLRPVGDLTLERVNRLTQAVADLTESHAAQGRMTTRLLTQMNEYLASIDTRVMELSNFVRTLSSEQILLGNRIEEAFIRLDQREDGG